MNIDIKPDWQINSKGGKECEKAVWDKEDDLNLLAKVLILLCFVSF
jgi:hypothetical protein